MLAVRQMRPRRTFAIAKPRAVRLHTLALVGWRVTRAGRKLVGSRRRPPPDLGTIVGVVGCFERRGAGDELAKRELLRRAVAAPVGKREIVAGEQALPLLGKAQL